jgi:hypothetical protein
MNPKQIMAIVAGWLLADCALHDGNLISQRQLP